MAITSKTTIISAPSGGGKTTLVQRLIKDDPNYQVVTSHTTRSPRDDEQDGRHYHFVSRDQFETLRDDGAFLEYAEVFGNLYGTSMTEIARLKELRKVPVLEIDVQGFLQVRPRLPSYYSVFIFPPSIEKLWERLESRASETEDVRRLRLTSAIAELEQAHHYDNFIINDDVDKAYEQLKETLAKGILCEQSAIKAEADRLIQQFRGDSFQDKLKLR